VILEHLDTVIAFAVVMLLLSLLITALVQLTASLLGLRGMNLLWGIERLLLELDPELGGEDGDAKGIAREILGYPVLSTTTNHLTKAIDRILQSFGQPPRFNFGKRAPTAIRADEVRLVIERIREQGEVGRLNNDKLDAKTVEDGLKGWFDIVMDATSERFKLRTRWWTVIFAGLIAFGLQVDSLDLFGRLSNDPELRAALAAQADAVKKVYEASLKSQQEPEAETDAPAPVERALENVAASLERLDAAPGAELRPMRCLGKDAETSCIRELCDMSAASWAGRLMTVLFLSLGGPFWYKTLSDVVGLRSVVARKQEKESGPEGERENGSKPESG